MGTTGQIKAASISAAARHLDDMLDEALAQSFPASDPIAISFGPTPEERSDASVASPDRQSTQAPSHPTAFIRPLG